MSLSLSKTHHGTPNHLEISVDAVKHSLWIQAPHILQHRGKELTLWSMKGVQQMLVPREPNPRGEVPHRPLKGEERLPLGIQNINRNPTHSCFAPHLQRFTQLQVCHRGLIVSEQPQDSSNVHATILTAITNRLHVAIDHIPDS